jgi:hypothetical protein
VQVGDGFEGDGDESAERATLDGDLIAGGRVVAGLVVVAELASPVTEVVEKTT